VDADADAEAVAADAADSAAAVGSAADADSDPDAAADADPDTAGGGATTAAGTLCGADPRPENTTNPTTTPAAASPSTMSRLCPGVLTDCGPTAGIDVALAVTAV
jgi:hypothetical protein